MDRNMDVRDNRRLVTSESASLVAGVYLWMALGVGISALVSLFFMGTGLSIALMQNPLMMIMLSLGSLGFCLFISFRADRMGISALKGSFLTYSGIMGILLSAILLSYAIQIGGSTVLAVFAVSSIGYLALGIYGTTTKSSLGFMGSFLMFGLIGLIIMGLINMFVASAQLNFIYSLLGVGIFAGLTAYDAQRIKNEAITLAQQGGTQSDLGTRFKIFNALSMYLNFINLFLFLLRLVASSRD